MGKFFVIIISLILTSCAIRFWDEKSIEQNRVVASLSVQLLAREESLGLSQEIDEKLVSLHSYQLIAQRYLIRFDDEIKDKKLEDLYGTEAYLSLVAAKTQIDEIEGELTALELILKDRKDSTSNHALLKKKLLHFSRLSPVHAASLDNLLANLQLRPEIEPAFSLKELELEYQKMQGRNEFQIYEKNIEHNSHLLEMRLKTDSKKFYPSTNDSGNVTGLEFPAKVWSLTFEDGPHSVHSRQVVEKLKMKNMTASFFMLPNALKKNLTLGKLILKQGHEIAAHSLSHRPLTQVGEVTMDREINGATLAIEDALQTQIKYFRLPYGIGVKTPDIREKIATRGLINVIYTIDSLDWISQDPDKIIKRTKALMRKTPRDSGILLFHDTYARSVIASGAIMDYLNQGARRTCTIGQIVSEMNEGVETVCPNF